jgi:membrane glycosyltransferase
MHEWQDIVLAVGQLALAIALVPTVLSHHKPALWTSTITSAVLVLFAVTYASLSLWYATFTTSLAAAMWIILAAQKILQRGNPS